MIRRLPRLAPISVLLLSGSAGVLSLALLVGLFEPRSTALLLVMAFALLIAGGFGLAPATGAAVEELTRRVLWVTVLAQMVLLVILPPVKHPTLADPLLFRCVMGLALLLAGTYLPIRARGLADPRAWGLVACYLVCGAWVITAVPNPLIDVHVVQQMGVQLSLEGQNPYSIRTYPDLYGSDSPFYGPGMAEGGRLTFGFPYPPLSFLLAVPGYALFGDHRYSLLFAMAAAALLITGTRPGERSSAAALLLLFSPATFYLIESAWIEPYGIALMAAVVFAADRNAMAASLALGLLMVAKQTLVPVVLTGAFLLARPWRQSVRIALVAGITGAAVSLPLIALNVHDFIDSAVTLQLRQPFRPESMTISAWLSDNREPALPVWSAFVAMGGVTLLALVRLPRTAAGFGIAVAASYFAFFLVSKYAFANYYWFVLAAICCALGAADSRQTVSYDPRDSPTGTMR